MTENIFFHTAETSYVLRSKKEIRIWLQAIAKRHKHQLVDLNVIFCSDPYLHRLNVEFLQHDTYTDIITFDHSEGSKSIRGELYISLDRVKENASLLGISLRDEIHRVMAHGVLHLCGFKDKKPADKKRMTKEEDLSLSLRKFL